MHMQLLKERCQSQLTTLERRAEHLGGCYLAQGHQITLLKGIQIQYCCMSLKPESLICSIKSVILL